MGCDIYTDENTCFRCYAHKYLNVNGFDYNNKCLQVDEEVKYCKYYDTKQVCIECD